MVLVINNVIQEEPPPDSRTLFLNHPSLKQSAEQFLSVPVKVVCSNGLLYVMQREMAVTVSYDKSVTLIGSDDVTTCIIIILRHSVSGAIGLAHLDGACTEECVTNMVHRVQELSLGYQEGRYELFLVGGFSDSRHYSEDLFYAIMHSFHKQPIEVHLLLSCVGEHNTMVRSGLNCPIAYGVGVNIRTREMFPATFPDKGPEKSLRMARQLTGGQQVLDIYDCSLGMLRVGPFNYEPLRGVDLWLEQSDEFILQHLSTTPDVEPPHFVMETTLTYGMQCKQDYNNVLRKKIRAALKYIHDHPFPAVTVFPDNQPRCYRRDEHTGLWAPFRYDNFPSVR